MKNDILHLLWHKLLSYTRSARANFAMRRNQWTKLTSEETSCCVDLLLRVCCFKTKSESIFCVSEILNGFVFSTLLRLAKADSRKISKKEQGEEKWSLILNVSKQVYLLFLYLHKKTNFVYKHVTHNLYRKKQISVSQVLTYDCLASE